MAPATPPIFHHDEVTSTNDIATAHALAGAESGTAVVARRQTHGRGRLGRTWLTLPGEHVFLSLLWRPPSAYPAEALGGFSLAAGLAVADAIAALGVAARVKWPNDVWVGGKKVAGILSELHDDPPRGHVVVIGIGVDVNAARADLPNEIDKIATTLAAELGHEVDIAEFVNDLVDRTRIALDAAGVRGGPDLAAYAARCVTIGAHVRVDGREGQAVGVAKNGALLVAWASSPEAPAEVIAGDVEIIVHPAAPAGPD